jgi:CYTH domain-containing protein
MSSSTSDSLGATPATVPPAVAAPGEDGPVRTYARPELERRFLLDVVPDGVVPTAHLEDRYLDGTRLRLRRVEHADGTVVHKFGQKVRPEPDDPAEVWLTNLYLDDAEAELLGRLPGRLLVKDRFDWPEAGFSVDVFAGALDGLVLAEVEHVEREAFLAVAAPPGAVADVTHDDRFSGGRLVGTTSKALSDLLAEVRAGGSGG